LNPVPLLDRKRRSKPLTAEEIAELVDAFSDGVIEDYQMSAFAMAVCCNGMTSAETVALTKAMLESGGKMTWGKGPPVVDKHSTGGQGDKSSLVLAPLLACLGMRVPMISGRGLGPTGGTLDKLSAIQGFRTDVFQSAFRKQVESIGCAMAGQTEELCPADRKLYALRDATGTVASIPLITSSILCKKLAETLDALVLDVKFGPGAFLPALADCRKLAKSLVTTAKKFGLKATALLTSMEQPTGRMVGNSLEVKETLECLEGRGPADLMELVYALAVELLSATKIEKDKDAALAKCRQAIESGAAMAKWRDMVVAQGGRPDAKLNIAPAFDLKSDSSGRFLSVDGSKVGYALIALGGGRVKTTDHIDVSVGFEFLKRLGDEVNAGEPLLKIYAQEKGKDEAVALLKQAIVVGDGDAAVQPLVLERVG
jgi:pyrimidine-nucleoside phosphorylase